ncbi:MAG TPA: bifunctional nicotinamidase/pyrazinamidase [Thermoanaerobaculia bacterium]|nr:bifunctional nicotinamidase/pyrazinamidase [Thermoanaerobaculia bacterium]
MRALILVDIQNDFCPGGTLAVREGDAVVPLANRLMSQVDLVVATQDWHPAEHGSFAVNHPGRQPFELAELAGLPQVLWPAHCVQWTGGALFHPGLDSRRIARVVPKGTDPRIDSYSGFFDNGRRKATGLHEWLQSQGVDQLLLCGMATDYCVKATALDAVSLGYGTTVVADACRGVNLAPGDIDQALAALREAGVAITQVDAVEGAG